MNMRYTFLFPLLIVSLLAQAQSQGPQAAALFLLKLDSSGSIVSNKVSVANGRAYGYFINRVGSEILVHGYIEKSLAIDSQHYSVSSSDSFPGHVTLHFDSSLTCTQVAGSSFIPLNQIRKRAQRSTYTVSLIADELRVDGQQIPNVGDRDVQVSAFENGNLKWNQLVGTVHDDVPYSLFYDSVEHCIYVTGYISYRDSSEEDPSSDFQMVVGGQSYDPYAQEVGAGIAPFDKSSGNNAYLVHPNPFSHYIDVRIEGAGKQDLHYRFLSANGTLVKSGGLSKETRRISGLSGLAPGAYFLSVLDSNNMEIHRTMVIKK